MTNPGYQQAIDNLAFEIFKRIKSIHTDMLLTGNTKRWEALGDGCKVAQDPEFGEDFIQIGNIIEKISEQYNVPFEQVVIDSRDRQTEYHLQETLTLLDQLSGE